jgi:hypothetical protein
LIFRYLEQRCPWARCDKKQDAAVNALFCVSHSCADTHARARSITLIKVNIAASQIYTALMKQQRQIVDMAFSNESDRSATNVADMI